MVESKFTGQSPVFELMVVEVSFVRRLNCFTCTMSTVISSEGQVSFVWMGTYKSAVVTVGLLKWIQCNVRRVSKVIVLIEDDRLLLLCIHSLHLIWMQNWSYAQLWYLRWKSWWKERDTFYATIESVRCYLSLKGKISFSFFDIIKGNSACTGDVKTLLSLCCDNLVISDSRVLKLVNKRKLHDLLSMSISGWCTIILTLQTVNFVSKIRLGQVKI